MLASIVFKRSKENPCLFNKCFQDEGLSMRNAALQTKSEIRHVFDCDEVGVMKEYIG
jgi:hypothetical protein